MPETQSAKIIMFGDRFPQCAWVRLWGYTSSRKTCPASTKFTSFSLSYPKPSSHLLSCASCSCKNMQGLNPQDSYFIPLPNRVALEMTQSICNSGLTSWLVLICSYTNDHNKLCVDLKVGKSMSYHPYQKLICNGRKNTSYQCQSLQVDDP